MRGKNPLSWMNEISAFIWLCSNKWINGRVRQQQKQHNALIRYLLWVVCDGWLHRCDDNALCVVNIKIKIICQKCVQMLFRMILLSCNSKLLSAKVASHTQSVWRNNKQRSIVYVFVWIVFLYVGSCTFEWNLQKSHFILTLTLSVSSSLSVVSVIKRYKKKSVPLTSRTLQMFAD